MRADRSRIEQDATNARRVARGEEKLLKQTSRGRIEEDTSEALTVQDLMLEVLLDIRDQLDEISAQVSATDRASTNHAHMIANGVEQVRDLLRTR